MRFRCYLDFQDEPTSQNKLYIQQMVVIITADSHFNAMTIALKFFDDEYAVNGVKLRNINLYQD